MAATFNINARDPMPLYAQLERAIRFAIATGKLAIGAQLPTVRQLAVELRINANTVAKVYAELERGRVVETRRGVGTFVLEPPPRTASASAARRAGRERELRLLAERFLAEAVALGFSPAEVLEHLAGHVGKGV